MEAVQPLGAKTGFASLIMLATKIAWQTAGAEKWKLPPKMEFRGYLVSL